MFVFRFGCECIRKLHQLWIRAWRHICIHVRRIGIFGRVGLHVVQTVCVRQIGDCADRDVGVARA